MRENKSPLTVSQALKAYTGKGIVLFAAQLVWLEMSFFVAASVVLILMIMTGDGISYQEAAESVSDIPMIDFFMALSISLLNSLMLLTQYRKSVPGGKLFRTMKGGFGTFAGYYKGICIAEMLAAAADCCVFLLLDTFGIVRLHGGASAVIAAFVSLTVASGAVPLVSMSENDAFRALMSIVLPVGITAAGTLLLPTLGMGFIPHIITGVAGTVFLIVSARAYLSYYKKNLWKN